MSQDFDDPELFADFIIEAREHLETIEPNLLELEKAPDNLSLLNEIFRPMHSLKGASGFLGLNKINMLAHRAENIMDELRKGEMTVSTEIMDVILSATDLLRQMIENLDKSGSEGDVETEDTINLIDTLMAGGAIPAAASAPDPTPIATTIDTTIITVTPTPVPVTPVATAPCEPAPAIVTTTSVPISSEDWIAGQPDLPAYALTAFGEGHLKDFIEESRDIIEKLSTELLDLENTENSGDLVNDLFRYFHNLKGNSGIIGYNEVNQVTHEAETLLNNVRKGEMEASQGLIDMLLFVTDVLETLIARIDAGTAKARPFETTPVVLCLQKAVNGEGFELPRAIVEMLTPTPVASGNSGTTNTSNASGTPTLEEITVFTDTVAQQFLGIPAALGALEKDGTQNDQIELIHRSLVAIQNATNFMQFTDIKQYAERTAGIVKKGQETGLDFALMVSLLSQEIEIIQDMVKDAVSTAQKNATAAPAPALPPPVAPATSAPAQPATPVAKLATPAPKPATPVAPATVAKPAENTTPKTSSTIRVDHEKLDHLMNLIGELIINRNRYYMLAKHLEDGVNIDLADVAQNLSETTYAMGRISDDLQDTIMNVRMVPVSSVFSRFPRLVRDLARKSDKDVDLVLEGEETELDKSVVEVIGDPLVHLIRNSVDHGIESAEERLAKGKSTKGLVTLRAYHKGNVVAIEIEDDGKGIDPEKMREVAVRKGILSAEDARNLDDREARELIFAPGFSSAEQITDISGRGVGMDVVRTNIKSLKGSISISSEVGKGSKFTLSLPLTLAIIDALMVTVDNQTFAIPLDAVSETTKIEASRLTDVKGRKAVTLRGDVLGIVNLSELLELSPSPPADILSVVIIQDNDRRLGMVVDRLLERQEIVIKPLGAYLGDLKGISGATILGDGGVILILDPHEIYLMATSKAIQ